MTTRVWIYLTVIHVPFPLFRVALLFSLPFSSNTVFLSGQNIFRHVRPVRSHRRLRRSPGQSARPHLLGLRGSGARGAQGGAHRRAIYCALSDHHDAHSCLLRSHTNQPRSAIAGRGAPLLVLSCSGVASTLFAGGGAAGSGTLATGLYNFERPPRCTQWSWFAAGSSPTETACTTQEHRESRAAGIAQPRRPRGRTYNETRGSVFRSARLLNIRRRPCDGRGVAGRRR